ncbi:hypothetical protein HHI36_016157 [Cryptolaemus montrouzieri]|uniref:GP-PDE domain-containing protein n=1 Tax=Cryptolaemus montrouzieri TaxID=559131 RepID=A0ABD2NIU4_9CUCU
MAAISLTLSSWKRYQENPTVVSLEKDFRNWMNPFPAVTGCFLNRTNVEKATERWNIGESEEKFEYYLDFIKVVSNSSYRNLDEFERFKGDATLQNIDMIEIATHVHPELMGGLVTFDPKVKSKWMVIMTEVGLCFTVNSKFASLLEIMVPGGNISNDDEFYLLRCHYLNGQCYARYDSDASLEIKYYVHSFLDVIHTTTTGPIIVRESQEMDVSFRMQETTSSVSLRALSATQRGCRFHDEPMTKEVPIYSSTICYMLCRQKLTMKLCGCKPFFYIIGDSDKICDVDGLICLSKHMDKLTSDPAELDCKCPQSCDLIRYLPQVPKITNWESGYFDQRITFRWGLIPPTTKYIRDVIFGIDSFVAMVNLFLYSINISTIFCGSARILGEVFLSYIPIGILLTICIVGGVYYFRVPPPGPEVVDAILGRDLSEVDSNNSGYVVRTVAHRGAGLDAPENTLEAFTMCKEKGCDFIEFDVGLTVDGVPVVFHDSNLQRMADSDLVVRETKWKDLSGVNLSVKHPFKDRYPQTNIPTLEQTVNHLLAAGQRMFIDIKDNDSKMIKVILDLYEKHPELESRVIVSSFSLQSYIISGEKILR